MRKFRLLLISGLIFVLIACLSSCDGQKVDNSSITIDIWTYYRGEQKESFEREIERYNKTIANSKKVVFRHKSFSNVDEINDNILKSSRDDAGSHPMPDLFITYKGIGRKVNENYKLLNFEDYFTKDELDEYIDSFVDVGYIREDNKKKLIMFPIAKSSDILLINDTEFSKFMRAMNIAYEDLEEYDSLVETAHKYYIYTDSLTLEEGDGKALFGIDSVANYFLVSLKQLGLDLLSVRDGETVLNLSKENARKIWDNYYVPVVKGYAGKRGKFVSEDIKVGNLILGLSYTTSASYFPKRTYVSDESKDIELKVMHSPYMKGGSGLFINQGGGIFVVDTNDRKNKACMDFVKWITDEENNLNFTIRSSYFPVKKDAMRKDVISLYEEENDIDENIVKTLSIGINQFVQMNSYTPEALDGYEEVRLIIEKDFAQLAKNDAKDVKDRVKRGERYEDVLKKYLSDEYFDTWYESFTQKIKLTLEDYAK